MGHNYVGRNERNNGMYYRDLREHIQALERNGLLVRIREDVNKDTELMPLVRWQFRGLPEEQRKAFLFENVVDAKGKKYDIPVLVASHAASRQVYALGMQCKPNEIMDKWVRAQLHPIEPVMVESGPVQEEIHQGQSLLEHGGLAEIPIPISTPGFDNAPYLTNANWVSKDPETGIRNIGNYRVMIKSPNRTGICAMGTQHIRTHWEKCRRKGNPLEAAIFIGASPNLSFVSVVKVPYGTDEYNVAGGIAGEAVPLVKCQTIDIEVPATAEIVIEGVLPTDYMEREAPFGEFTGYMGAEEIMPFFNVTCITHRKNPIYNAFISQFPPSESSKIKQVGGEAAYFKFLKHDCNIPGLLDVVLDEPTGIHPWCIIQMRKFESAHIWQALNAVVGFNAAYPKVVIAVDEDIDPRDPDAVNWAISFRVQPHRDIKIMHGRVSGLDHSTAPLTSPQSERRYPSPNGGSALLIDATTKWPYPPVSLPRKDFMERAKARWEELGLPPLKPKSPWHGYSLGYWTEENEQEAELALQGEHYQTGEKLAQRRVKADEFVS
ncbi:MAG: UbiD family decarboxylase [Chloroflexi bacterium]|nr:UbiD family decarboxylase [Chloroflexota bacterium]